jgi:hypothetical protein
MGERRRLGLGPGVQRVGIGGRQERGECGGDDQEADDWTRDHDLS